MLLVSSKYQSRPMVTSIPVGVKTIKHLPFARNLGVFLDQDIVMDKHTSMICKTSQHHLWNIRKILKFLDPSSAETLVHSFVTSKIDYCNALLFGLPKYQINRLQLVLNTAALVVTLALKYDHITPAIKLLNWLPVSQRITFKIGLLLVIYKVLSGLAPIYLCDLLAPCCCKCSLRSCSQELLSVPRSRIVTYGDRAFFYYWTKALECTTSFLMQGCRHQCL